MRDIINININVKRESNVKTRGHYCKCGVEVNKFDNKICNVCYKREILNETK